MVVFFHLTVLLGNFPAVQGEGVGWAAGKALGQ